MSNKVAILAGGGDLPRRVALSCRAAGNDVVILAFDGHTDAQTPAGFVHKWVRLGAVGTSIDWLKAEGVGTVCMIGPMRRPSMRELRPDWRAAKLLAHAGLHRKGDDALLGAARRFLESEGLQVVGVHELLGDLLAVQGTLTHTAPDADAWADIRRGVEVVRALGALDVGQGAVVQQGLVLAVEAIEGTDGMLARCADLRRQGPGGVLVKLRKPQQDSALDLPTIGELTIEAAHRAGLRGIAIEAGASLVVDAGSVARKADSLGLFVEVFDPDAPGG